jgi:hypothetical protein
MRFVAANSDSFGSKFDTEVVIQTIVSKSVTQIVTLRPLNGVR